MVSIRKGQRHCCYRGGCEPVCLDPYDKQIVKYLTVLPSM